MLLGILPVECRLMCEACCLKFHYIFEYPITSFLRPALIELYKCRYLSIIKQGSYVVEKTIKYNSRFQFWWLSSEQVVDNVKETLRWNSQAAHTIEKLVVRKDKCHGSSDRCYFLWIIVRYHMVVKLNYDKNTYCIGLFSLAGLN